MAVSGTNTAEIQKVGQLIEDAWVKAGTKAQNITSEKIREARNDLWRMLKSMQNKGITLWTTEKVYLGLRLNKPTLPFPAGTIDVLNANYLKLTFGSGGTAASSAGGTAANAFDGDFSTACTQTSADGNISYQYTAAVVVTHMGVCSNGTQTYDLVFEASNDGSTWTTILDTASQSFTDDDIVWFEAEYPLSATYFRVRETGGGTLDVRQVLFGYNPTSTPMSKQNRDDYFSLPNRFTTNADPLQYWLDRQRSAPTMYVWPAPGNRTRAVETYVRRQIYDVGQLADDVDIPQRWFDAILYGLALRLAENAEQIDPTRIQYLAQRSMAATNEAFNEEVDTSAIDILPDLTVYTR